jgi:hypothetical protein
MVQYVLLFFISLFVCSHNTGTLHKIQTLVYKFVNTDDGSVDETDKLIIRILSTASGT